MTQALLLVPLALLAALGLLALHVLVSTRVYRRPRWPDERHFVRTEDGWVLALSRIRPDPDGPAAGMPVICCHGLACNARTFDLDDRLSLARHLAARGFDVWMLDLRGAGHSARPGLDGRRWAYGFGEHVGHDAPAAIRHVLATTGRPDLFWVGHSMGGLIGYWACARAELGRRVRGLVTLGSPLDLSGHRRDLGWMVTFVDLFLRTRKVIRLGLLGRVVAPFAGRLRSFPEPLFLDVHNVRARVLRHFLVDVMQDVPRRVVHEFLDAILRQTAFDGRAVTVVQGELRGCTAPLLVVAGSTDRMAPEAACHGRLELLGSPDRTAVVVGKAGGAASEFGHLDLVLGEAAPAVVYPQITEWLLARVPRREAEDLASDDAAGAG